MDSFLDYVFKVSNLVPGVHRRRPSLRDPDDERILEAALECRAMIVTHNTRDFVGKQHLGIAVQTPREFLQRWKESNEYRQRS